MPFARGPVAGEMPLGLARTIDSNSGDHALRAIGVLRSLARNLGNVREFFCESVEEISDRATCRHWV